MNNSQKTIIIDNLDTLFEISKIKSTPIQTLMNYIVDQYILYFNDQVKSLPEDQVKPRKPVKRDRSLMSFREFINSSRYKPSKGNQ